MEKNKLFAFFTKPLNRREFDEYTDEAWKQTVCKALNEQEADVILVKPSEWNVPELKSMNKEEIAGLGIARIGFPIAAVLKQHGVPQVVINSYMPEIDWIPYPEYQMWCFVFEYTIERQKL